MSSFDVVIIGSGPGGYVAAIRCAQLGMKTAIIEKYATLGGTCLNVGCIPSKALLASSHHYQELQHFADHGIEVSGEVKVNLEKMIARKQAVVDQTSGGVKYLMDKNNVTVFEGLGSFVDATHVAVAKADGTSETLEAKSPLFWSTRSVLTPISVLSISWYLRDNSSSLKTTRRLGKRSILKFRPISIVSNPSSKSFEPTGENDVSGRHQPD